MKIDVMVIPNSKQAKVERNEVGLRVKVNAPAKEGKANKKLIEILAKHYSRPKSSIKIIRGLTSKKKLIEIEERLPRRYRSSQ